MTKIPTDFNFFYPPSLLTYDWSLYRIQKLHVEPSCTVSIACEQALHLEESGEVTREQHAKGHASARGVERRESFPFLYIARLRCLLVRSRAASFACLRACSQATVSIVNSTIYYLSFDYSLGYVILICTMLVVVMFFRVFILPPRCRTMDILLPKWFFKL